MYDFNRLTTTIERGGIIAMPTETVYGLVTDAGSQSAVSLLRKIKQKPPSEPIPVFIHPETPFSEYTEYSSEIMQILEQEFMPGPLMLVVRARENITRLPVCIDDKIGLRKSSMPAVNELLERSGRILTATSANISGSPPALDEDDVKKMFSASEVHIIGKPEGIVIYDKPSTSLLFEAGSIKVLREGAIPVERINSVLSKQGIKQRLDYA
ncbi:MAG: hypothetical protein GF307_04465 [candidate division Zixibacteria bacterium]|nr:hypothetical protein [candidate division Zixibacteria bacterium]